VMIKLLQIDCLPQTRTKLRCRGASAMSYQQFKDMAPLDKQKVSAAPMANQLLCADAEH